MKQFKWTIFGIVAVEVGLAWLHAPFVSLPLVIGTLVLGLAFWLFGQVFFAQLADRQRERQAWLQMAQMQHETTRYTLATVSQANLQQQQIVNQLLGLGATLRQFPDGDYYAQLPGGDSVPVEATEAEYWVEVAPQRAALPPGRRD